MRAPELATSLPANGVLEVAVGTGAILLQIVKRVDKPDVVCGVDLSLRMPQRTKRLVEEARYRNPGLCQAAARQLPFRDEAFDLIYSSYLLDLLALKDLPIVLVEPKRLARRADGSREPEPRGSGETDVEGKML